MTYLFSRIATTLLLCALFSSMSVFAQQGSDAPLTNAAIVKLVRAGFKEKTIISIIHNRVNQFKLDPDRLIDLKRSGVGENIILAMLSQDDSGFIDSDDWSDNTFSKERSRRSNGQENPDPQAGGTDIFGSSGGSKGQIRQRGGNGSSQGEVTTTGSATVRILRPASEAGDTPVKLEKTPTLNNDAIIKLVEAGFSEGTIVKRIEDSPAEFDLTVAKLEELRKRRVSETVISAMTAAMDDSSSTQTAPGKSREN
jgi:hypothetical protein